MLLLQTDGHKTNEGAGSGIYCAKPKARILLSLSKTVTELQSEKAAVHYCAKEISRQMVIGKAIVLYSGYHGILKALHTSTLIAHKSCVDKIGSHYLEKERTKV